MFLCLFLGTSMAPVIEQIILLSGLESQIALEVQAMNIETESESSEKDKEESQQHNEKEKWDEKEMNTWDMAQANIFLDNILRVKHNHLQHLYENSDLSVPTPPPEVS